MDAFEDLWKQAAPASAQQQAAKSQPLNAAAAASAARPAWNKPDTFSLLSSAPGSRSLTPSLPVQRPTSAASGPAPIRAGNGDAFSGLMSFGDASASMGNLSLADRQTKMEQERKEREKKQHEEIKAQGAFWDRFGGDGLLKPTPMVASTSRTPSPALEPIRPSHISKPTSKPAAASVDAFDLFDFDSLGAPPASGSHSTSGAVSPSPAAVADPFDLDAFGGPLSTTGTKEGFSAPKGPTPRSISPGDFDFGDREDWGMLEDDDEDDILGALNRPVTETAVREDYRPVQEIRQAPQGARSPAPPRSRGVSPPPHIIGQIVEMGFSPQQARFALATTESGLDVQAALDMLLASQVSDEPAASVSPPLPSERSAEEEASERRRRRRQGPTRQRVEPAPAPPQDDGLGTPNLQEHADRLLAQASDFGLTMFSRANALWKQGREQVQKAYEERAKAGAAPVGPAGRVRTESGRPKWLEGDGWEEPVSPISAVHPRGDGGFRDDHGDLPSPDPRAPEPSQPRHQQQERRPEPSQPRKPESRPPEKVINLFGDEPIGYVSPARRRYQPAHTNGASSSARAAAPASPAPPPPKPKPKPKPARRSFAVSPSALSAAETHRSKGTEFFKLGQFGDAESSYTAALEVLPEAFSGRIPLHNNRAAARLKTGNSSGVVEDCSAVISLLAVDGIEYKPDEEEEWEGIKLGDALVKAVSRRAEAWEMSEKWEKAADDWQRVVSLGTWIGKSKWDIATRGLERCKRLKAGEAKAAAPPPPKPKPKPKPPVSLAPAKPSQAVVRLQEANQQQDEEENLRAALKDSVDARLLAWKAGKETNIRALIASLETVLWEELGWQKVGLGELVSPGQVKARYVRAIARLHPDKLSATKATVEHRMIANGVFGTLNEAWNAFQQ